MARTSADAVRAELDVSAEDYPSIEDDDVGERQPLDRWLSRANRLVEKRLVARGETDETFLADVETLVAAHFGAPVVSDVATGNTVLSSVSQGSGQASYESENIPGGDESVYWHQAVELTDGQIAATPFFSHTL